MNYKKNQSGFSLIDAIIGIMIFGFVLIGVLFVLLDLRVKSVENEVTAKGTTYANSIMNYIRGHRFDENYSTLGPPWTFPLGQDGGGGGDYDDIDDFIGADWSIIPGYAELGYQATSDIFYVDERIDILANCGYMTYYKRITVTVSHAGLANPIVLTSIMTPHGE